MTWMSLFSGPRRLVGTHYLPPFPRLPISRKALDGCARLWRPVWGIVRMNWIRIVQRLTEHEKPRGLPPRVSV